MLLVVIVVAVVGVGVGIWMFMRRRGYIKSLEARGWQFETSPSPEITFGLTVPPFGLSFDRRTDELITGRTAGGVPFQVFEFLGVPSGRIRVATVPLGFSLPELAVSAAPPRPEIAAQAQFINGLHVASPDNVFAQEFITVAGGRLGALATHAPLDLTVDGDQIVAIGVGKEPEAIAAFTDALGGIATAVSAHDWGERRQPPVPRTHGFYREPTWSYLPSDDSWLHRVQVTTGGNNHRTSNVLTGLMFPGCSFVAFTHHWETTRIVTESDGKGGITTRTVTDHHAEEIFQVDLPFSMPPIAVSPDSRLARLFSGGTIDFELHEFNKAYDVFAKDRKYAYDIIHPRMIEYLLALPQRLSAGINGSIVRINCFGHQPAQVGYELSALAGFFNRIPPFVWQNLGLRRPEIGRLDPTGRPT